MEIDICSMSTRTGAGKPTGRALWASRRVSGPAVGQRAERDPADTVAEIAVARRDLLLRVHRHRLRREELEDCYSQAIVELVLRARSGTPFCGPDHIANSVEQKFLSRIHDRRRALAGRSSIEAALGLAVPLEGPDGGGSQLADASPSVDECVARRLELRQLREVAAELSPDQRLVLACQVGLDMDCGEFCRRYGWSAEKFRKVAQRARARLVRLFAEYAAGERCNRLEADFIAVAARVADPDQAQRVERHLSNCPGCRRAARELSRAERRILGVLPLLVKAGSVGVAGGGGTAVVAGAGAAAGAGSAAGVMSGTGAVVFGGAGLGAVKLAASALCIATMAGGGLLLCQRTMLGSGKATAPVAQRAHRVPSAAVRRPIDGERGVIGVRSGTEARLLPTTLPQTSAYARGHRSPGPRRPVRSQVPTAAREFVFSALAPSRAATARHDLRVASLARGRAGLDFSPGPSSGAGAQSARGSHTAISTAHDFGFERH